MGINHRVPFFKKQSPKRVEAVFDSDVLHVIYVFLFSFYRVPFFKPIKIKNGFLREKGDFFFKKVEYSFRSV